jgi:DNA mismatch repair protein MutH
MKLPYNPKDKKSVISFAKKLIGNSLSEVCHFGEDDTLFLSKGSFGHLLEKYYFGYNPNSNSEADFIEIGVELKSSPLKELASGEYKSKERLVLSIINYMEIVKQNFDTSEFWKKNSNLLLVFYLYESGVRPDKYVIKLVDEWVFPDADLVIIKKDWEFIRDKVLKGKAHEISEGDTFYLGACTKGASAASVRKQPYNKIDAKQRAYSLKQGYVNHIIASISKATDGVYGKLIPPTLKEDIPSIEDVVRVKFERYYGKSVEEILALLDVSLRPSKSFYANLTNIILGIELDKKIEEFEKADVRVRTVRLKENSLPKEDVSFPSFKYEEIVREEWDESDIKNILEKKIFFVFYQFNQNQLILKKAIFWNMPYHDLLEVERVWRQTKKIVKDGDIVKEVIDTENKSTRRSTNFPNKEFSRVAHVRPHAQNANDVIPLPTRDKVTKLMEYTKHSFWLNSSYVRDEIFLKNR